VAKPFALGARLIDAPGTALRLMLAHAISGSGGWQVRADPQTAKNEAIAAVFRLQVGPADSYAKPL